MISLVVIESKLQLDELLCKQQKKFIRQNCSAQFGNEGWPVSYFLF